MGRTRGTGDVADVGRWIAAALLACVVAAGFRGPAPRAERSIHAHPEPGRTSSILVTVRGFDRVPVPGARVSALQRVPEPESLWPEDDVASLPAWRRTPGGWDQTPVATSIADDDGRATLAGVPAGRWLVRAEAPGRVVRSLAVDVDAPEQVVELLIEQGHAFEGRVVTPEGEGLGGYMVAAKYPPVFGSLVPNSVADEVVVARTGPDGRFRLDSIPSCLAELSCGTAAAWSSHTTRVVVPGVRRIDLVVARSAPVYGVVVDESDRPVEGADVLLRTRGFHTANVLSHAVTDAAGRFEIRDHASDVISELEVTAPGFAAPPELLEGRVPCRARAAVDAPRFRIRLSRKDPREPRVRLRFVGPDGPVRGVTVELSATQNFGFWEGSTPSDADGWVAFRGVPKGSGELRVSLRNGAGHMLACDAAAGVHDDAEDDGEFVPEERLLWIGGEPVEREFALVRGPRVHGVVVDAAGQTVAGARVRAGGVRTTSAADGTFELGGLSHAGTVVVRATADAPARSGESPPFVASPGEAVRGVRVALALLRIDREFTLAGRVVTKGTGAPVPAARIALAGGCVVAGLDGRFRVSAAARWNRFAGRLGIAGHTDVSVNWSAPDDVDLVDLGDLETAAEDSDSDVLTGVVRALRHPEDEEGDPVPFAAVVVEPPDLGFIACGPDEDPEPPIVCVADAEGRFRLDGFRDSAERLRAAAPGWLPGDAVVERSAGADEPTTVMLPLFAAATLRVRVVTTDGSPVRGAHVVCTGGDSQFFEADLTGADGRAALTVPGGVEHSLWIRPGEPDEADPFLDRDAEGIVAGPEETVIAVDPGGRIRGVVLRHDGEPAGGAWVEAEPQFGALGTEPQANQFNSATLELRADRDGRFEFRGLGASSYRLSAGHGLLTAETVETAAGGDAATLRLGPSTAIEGVLAGADGRPARGASLRARLSAEGGRSAWASTDGAGRFRFEVPEGATCDIRRSERGAPTQQEGDDYASTVPLTGGSAVRAGTTGLRLRVPGRRESSITVHVRRPDGAPAIGVAWEAMTSPRTHFVGSIHESDDISLDDLDLGAEIPVSVAAGGIGWTFPVRTGSHGTTLVVAPTGLLSASDGDQAVASSAAIVILGLGPGDEVGEPAAGSQSSVSGHVRLVNASTGAAREIAAAEKLARDPDDVPFVRSLSHGAVVRLRDLPVGPYRVEVRTTEDGPWREAKLVVASSGMPWFRIDSE